LYIVIMCTDKQQMELFSFMS